MLNLQYEVGLPDGRIRGDVRVGQAALASVVEDVCAVDATVSRAAKLGRDTREVSRVAYRGPGVCEEVHLVVGDACTGLAWRAAVGGLVTLAKWGADAVAVGAGHGGPEEAFGCRPGVVQELGMDELYTA
jgi:hypothetical protein